MECKPQKIKIKTEEVHSLMGATTTEFPKYTTQLLNLANQNSGATRPSNIGQLSDLIQTFSGESVQEWEEYYKTGHPKAIKQASKKIWEMVKKLKIAMRLVDKTMIEQWLEDLIYVKSFCGLNFQEAILAKISSSRDESYRLATPEEEAKQIDGYIGDIPVSIKPKSYKLDRSPQKIEVPIVYYDKKKDGISIEYNL